VSDGPLTLPRPTVLVATRNRASTLEAVLSAYCQLVSPPAGWDLVVMDNGSSDRTAEVVRAFRDRLPIAYAFEGTPGKNAALNTGLGLVTGELIVFTDDDIFPQPDWLMRLCEAAAAHESYSIFAGLISPRWEAAPSDVIRQAIPLGIAFAVHPPGLREGPVSVNAALGGNVALRSEIFRRGYRFNTSIGPRPSSYTMGSEAELIRRLVHDGMTIWCCEGAGVEHLVPRSHLETAWLMERAVRWGRCRRFFDTLESDRDDPSWLGVPRWIFRSAALQFALATRAALTGNAARLLHARWRLQFLRGVAYEARAHNKARLSRPAREPAVKAEPTSPRRPREPASSEAS
jgi:L-malate glycosyltransferase